MSYQDDVDAALQQARQDAYDRGDYYREEPDNRTRSMTEQEYVAWGQAQVPVPEGWEPNSEEHREAWRAAQVEVTGPDSLLDAQPFSGTHSIIDMITVSEVPDYNTVAPATEDRLLELFGTARPSTAAIEAAIARGDLEGFARWHGMYVVAFEDDKPSDIFFLGWSGD